MSHVKASPIASAGQNLMSIFSRGLRFSTPHTFCTPPYHGLFSVDSHLGTRLTRQPPQSSSKGNLCVRVQLGKVPSTVEKVRNCLQWGRSNLVDCAGWPKIRLLNRDSGNTLSIFPRKNSETQSSLNFL